MVYGTDTQNPVPGTPRFPIQLLTALAFLVLAAAAYVAFLKGRKLSVFVGILFLDWFIYYCGTCLYDQSANQMIIKGFNTALPLAITSGFAGIFTMCQTHRKGYEN